ncbi:MAG: hypothetical protein JW839_09835 [Candidatus Lokiarchaeota archaeon]|nr:hypothetical protein [Candidatus Lokiarchaeota archaeon]
MVPIPAVDQPDATAPATLWKEKAWALGVAFVCFTMILANGLYGTITFIPSNILSNLTTVYLQRFCWVAIVMVAFSGILRHRSGLLDRDPQAVPLRSIGVPTRGERSTRSPFFTLIG